MIRHARLLAVSCACALFMTACGKSSDAPPPASSAPAALPQDPKLAKLYEQTCMACHTKPGSGAPQAGSAADWSPRIPQGIDALLDHTINGYKGMPPLGSCQDCSEDEFRDLIRFMAGMP